MQEHQTPETIQELETWYPVEQVDWQESADEYFLQDGKAFDGTDFALTQYYAQTDTDSDWSSEDTWFTDNTDWDSDW